MVQIKNYESWSHTSALMALLVNINKDTKKHGVTPFDAFNPYVETEGKEKPKHVVTKSEAQYNFMLMKRTFVDNAKEYKKLPKGTPKVHKTIKGKPVVANELNFEVQENEITIGEKIIVKGVNDGIK